MPMYEYCCLAEHTTEHFFSVAEKPFAVKCPVCRKEALQVITASSLPALHTLATFSADIKDRAVQQSRDPGDGSYFDPNIFDRKTGKHPRITSRKQREATMKELGLCELPPSDVAKDADKYKRTKPQHFHN